MVAANAGNDAAGIATYASAGSQFIYRTLFFMVLVTIALVLVQEMAVRLGTHTGKGLAALIREQFSLRLTGVALFCVLLANTGLVVAEFAGIGAAFELLGVSRYVIIPVAAVAIWALVVFGSYRYAERVFLILSLAFLAYPIAVVLGHPNWAQVGSNLVIPHFLYTKSFLLLGRGPDRHHGQPVHAAVRGGGRGGQGRRRGRLPAGPDRRDLRRAVRLRDLHHDHHRDRRRHRRHRPAHLGQGGGPGAAPGGRARPPNCCSRSA